MLWEIQRILEEFRDSGRKMPRFLLMENVTAITGTACKKDFDE